MPTMSRHMGVAVLAAVLALAPGARAHHSIVGQFDVSKTVTLAGTVAKVDWINPHPYLHLDVKGRDGSVTRWALTSIPVAMMRKAGISRELLAGKPGETVTVAVHPALNGKRIGWMLRVTYADGHFFSLFEL
jgi:hypothetical protein